MYRSREVLFERIRQAHRDQGLSGREIAVRCKVWRRTMLREDLQAPAKQRHTIVRIMERLAAEHDFELAWHTTVWEYVRKRRPKIRAGAVEGRRHLDGVVPQAMRPGEEAEVGFADFWLSLAGQRRTYVLFRLRLSYSGRAVHLVYATASQEAFLEGHVEAFTVLGGVPSVHIRYDNLKPAVKQVLFGRSRVEPARWASFKSWYQLSAFYCAPGEDGAHEKGGVEHEGGRFRRKHLVPPPAAEALAERNERLAAIDVAEDARRIRRRPTSIGFDFEQEQARLRPLPAKDFDCGIDLMPTVARNSRITVRQGYYSVPAKFIGTEVRVRLRANELWVFDGRQVVARHPRLTRRHAYHDILDHYPEILLVKPGAFAGVFVLAQARAEGVLTKVHEAFWAAAEHKCGDREGTRMLIEVLLLHRQVRRCADDRDADVPADRLGQHRPGRDRGPQGNGGDRRRRRRTSHRRPTHRGPRRSRGRGQVISLHARRLPPDPRTDLPDMSKYDRSLTPVTPDSTTRKGHGA